MRTILALIGLSKTALASLYMGRGERHRVSMRARNMAFATLSSIASSIAADVRALAILSRCAVRDVASIARKKSK